MARASTRTALPLDRFAAIVGIHPLHFNQVIVADLAPATTCGDPVLQYSWQEADRVGREEIAQAIADAEDELTRYLNFKLVPTWEEDEQIETRPHTYWPQTVRTRWGYVLYGGRRTPVEITSAADIDFADQDGDGYKETASATVASPMTDLAEIHVYLPGHGGEPEWEIRPVRARREGDNVILEFKRELLVNPGLQEGLAARALDGLEDGNFVSSVAVHREYNDPSSMAQLLSYDKSCVPPVELGTADGAFYVQDARLGIIAVRSATWDATLGEYVSVPCDYGPVDRVRLWYRAGWRLQSDPARMDPMWERAVSYLALANLDRPVCGCEALRAVTEYWSTDLAERVQNRAFSITRRQADNPLGTTRAAMHAWDLIVRNRCAD